jgi:hypothetical protein
MGYFKLKPRQSPGQSQPTEGLKKRFMNMNDIFEDELSAKAASLIEKASIGSKKSVIIRFNPISKTWAVALDSKNKAKGKTLMAAMDNFLSVLFDNQFKNKDSTEVLEHPTPPSP